MKMKSIAGITCYVKDLDKTINFYENLGFLFRKKETNHATAYLNWFWIDFISIESEDKPKFLKEAKATNKGAGMFIYINVDDIDGFYEEVIANEFKPSSEPRDWPWGNREFALRDPDGYKLVFFKRK
jgi:catechol 2,3-dioxygenase-like lactoylglutathione lyase family enzyme